MTGEGKGMTGAFKGYTELANLLDSLELDSGREERINKLVDKLIHLYNHTEENIQRWQDWRDRGLVRSEVAFHVLAEIFEGMHLERLSKETLTKGRPINRMMKEWTDILKREGRDVRDSFPEGEEPKDFITLRKRLDKEGDACDRAMMREYGEKEMAELFFNDHDEYERRKDAGKAMLYAEPDIAEAQKQLDEIDKRILAEKTEEERRELEEAGE